MAAEVTIYQISPESTHRNTHWIHKYEEMYMLVEFIDVYCPSFPIKTKKKTVWSQNDHFRYISAYVTGFLAGKAISVSIFVFSENAGGRSLLLWRSLRSRHLRVTLMTPRSSVNENCIAIKYKKMKNNTLSLYCAVETLVDCL